MPNREVVSYGQCLAIAGGALTANFQGGTPIALQGVEEIDIELLAVFDAATTLTNQIFQVQVSDDLTNWEAVATVQASSGSYTTTATIAASAGNTVRDRVQVSSSSVMTVRNAKYVRVAVKATGTVRPGDSASANLKYSI